MTKKARLIILLVCVVCFFLIAPVLVYYSMGYRFDFQKMKITEIGGIYVRTVPAADQIVIDSKIIKKMSLLSNSVFVQNLLPMDHSILVEKKGYYNYYKIMPVQKKQVTKLENVLLFKKDISFAVSNQTSSQTDSPYPNQSKFIIKNNNLYYSGSQENSTLSATQKLTPVLKNVLTFAWQNNSITWLATDGFLYQVDLSGLSVSPRQKPKKVTATPLKIIKNGHYKLAISGPIAFLDNNGTLMILSQNKENLENFFGQAKNMEISPAGNNVVYYDDTNVYISGTEESGNSGYPINLLYKSQDIISDCLWLNNDYIIFVAGNNIIISEIDYRGNINSITLPQTINISGKEISIKNPLIYFNQQEGKLYILTGSTLISSEKLVP